MGCFQTAALAAVSLCVCVCVCERTCEGRDLYFTARKGRTFIPFRTVPSDGGFSRVTDVEWGEKG